MDLDEAEKIECVSSKQGKGVKYFFRLQAVLRKKHKRISEGCASTQRNISEIQFGFPERPPSKLPNEVQNTRKHELTRLHSLQGQERYLIARMNHGKNSNIVFVSFS